MTSIMENDATNTCLVREVLEQEDGFPAGLDDPKRQWKCWICLDRKFNAENQWVDHVRGIDGNGSKSHNKFRNRWCANGRPTREEWLNMLNPQRTVNMDAQNEQGEQPGLPLEERVSACESASGGMIRDSVQKRSLASVQPHSYWKKRTVYST